MDLSNLSDAELQRLYSAGSQPGDLSHLSDEQLLAMHRGDTGSLTGDWWRDAKRAAQGATAIFTDPVGVAKGIGDLTLGAASKLARKSGLVDAAAGVGQDEAGVALNRDIEKQKAGFRERGLDSVIEAKKQEWADPIHKITHEPFTAAMDIGTVAAPMAGLPGRVGATAGVISDVTNPFGLAVRGARVATRPIADYARSSGIVDRAAITRRRQLGQEFGVDQTRGQIAGDRRLLGQEDELRNVEGRGQEANRVMRGFDQRQDQQLQGAGSNLRSNISGAQPVPPSVIGDTLQTAYQGARNAAKQRVSGLYDRAFNPAELEAVGVDTRGVPMESIYGLRNNIEDAFLHQDRPGGVLVPTRATAPQTFEAIDRLGKFSDQGGFPFAFNKFTNPGPDGVPTHMGWQGVDLIRKTLDGLRNGARNNPTDMAAMRRLMDVFDEEIGKQNPLLNEARAAHAERVRTFDPHRLNDAATNGALKVLLADQNPGMAIYNKLFATAALKRGEAGPLIDQLKTIYAGQPQAMAALRDGALQRLLVDPKDFSYLSPQRASTAINQALNGPQAEVYRALFTQPQIDKLSRYRDLLDNVAKGRATSNPSGTSYKLIPLLKRGGGAVTGYATGKALGSMTGIPFAGEALGLTAGYGGSQIDKLASFLAARRAVSGRYSAPTVYPAVARSLQGLDRGLAVSQGPLSDAARASYLQGLLQ